MDDEDQQARPRATSQARHRQRMIAEGRCTQCGSNELKTKYHCARCAALQVQYIKVMRARYLAAGRCVTCGRLPLASARYCEKHVLAARADGAIKRARRRAAGVCVNCGGTPLETKTLCPACAAAMRASQQLRRREGLVWKPGGRGRPPKGVIVLPAPEGTT